MSFPQFGTPITITTRTPSGTDAYGNATYTDSTVTVTGAFAPVAGTENTDNEDQVISQPQAYLPAGTPVSSTSKLTINGTDYEVAGEPQAWESPFTGWVPGIAVTLRLVAG